MRAFWGFWLAYGIRDGFFWRFFGLYAVVLLVLWRRPVGWPLAYCPRVSILVAARNEAGTIERCLTALARPDSSKF